MNLARQGEDLAISSPVQHRMTIEVLKAAATNA
jgi:hypothetical protein